MTGKAKTTPASRQVARQLARNARKSLRRKASHDEVLMHREVSTDGNAYRELVISKGLLDLYSGGGDA